MVPLGTYLLIVAIPVESIALRSVELHGCTIDHFYTAFLVRKAQGAHPTVHLEKERKSVQTSLTLYLIFFLAFLFVSFVETRFSVCSPDRARVLRSAG